MNEKQMIEIVDRFIKNIEPLEEEIKVIQIPDFKTVHIETINEMGQSIILHEFHINGKNFWAGYSQRSETVFVSRASRD